MNLRSFIKTIGLAIPASIIQVHIDPPAEAPPTSPGFIYLLGPDLKRGSVRLAMVESDPMLDPNYIGTQQYHFAFPWLHKGQNIYLSGFDMWSADPPRQLTQAPHIFKFGPICVARGDTVTVEYSRRLLT